MRVDREDGSEPVMGPKGEVGFCESYENNCNSYSYLQLIPLIYDHSCH